MNNIDNPYSEYKKLLDSYKGNESIYMFGCDKFTNEHLKNAEGYAPKICNISVSFLSHLKEQNNPSYQENGCKYLYYWLHDEISDSKTIEDTLVVYKALNDIFNDENDGLNMFDNYINQMNNDIYHNIKKIILIYDEFNIFEKQVMPPSSQKKCTSECVTLFTNSVGECRKAYDYDFCNKLKKFRDHYNYFIQTILKCEGDQYLLPPVDNLDVVRMIIVPFVLILVACFILPLLYKFTPVGPWARHIIGKKKNTRDNINQEENHLLDDYEMEKDFPKKIHYKLAYNSS
ncbi:PIR Superfamily Protein [Plasmodium ovale curtisi]|uniref:PIR Superfamily Protein n=1 Tax=Plasmodium ovale curtisi TaxID=864141 RepID=A0A1A8X6I1_PLAOA|nr:PIR Superfamily Protein [Plasmodium ovale curtisi]